MRTDDETTVSLLEPVSAGDDRLTEELADLVNRVYATAESGLWRDGATRTTASELAGLIRAGEIAVARRGGQIVGSVRIHDVAPDTSEFGILVSAPEQRGLGIGTDLLAFVERLGRERGLRAIQLELLVPTGWSHPSKEFLRGWYGRSGYRLVRTAALGDAHPHLAPLLATDCVVEVYEKPLAS